MRALRLNKLFSFAFVIFLLLLAAPANAQIIIIPDCNLNPQSSFCQGKCKFVRPLPPWCEQPEPEPDPVIIVPALTASFNIKTIFRDQPTDNWRFVPFGRKVYRGLIERLENAGYEEDTNLRVAHYDWRQSNAESAIEYLKPIIDEARQASGADKVDIIAHSMGGLVAREYIQSDYYESDVDQLILLGTPNEGAADAYVAWEGGRMPTRWDLGMRTYIRTVEAVLKRTRDQDLKRPLSFRSFFPSLKDLLPITDFAVKNNNPLAVGGMFAQNDFLQNLRASANLPSERNVTVTSLAGNGLATLGSIALGSQRTPEDIKLERWRDGHPDPDPPLTDTAAGDQTVLLTSARLNGANITLDNIPHIKLPEEAQEEVLAALDAGTDGVHIAYDLPDSILGTVILSPIDPAIFGPNGAIISATENTFPDAEYVADSDDPNGPKLLVIANPPDGDYEITLTGTGEGAFTTITTYADENETQSVTEDGATTIGQTDAFTFTIGNNTFIPDLDLLELTEQLKQTIIQLHKDNHLTHYGNLLGKVNRLLNMKDYAKQLVAFNEFSKKLYAEIAKGHLDETAVSQLLILHDQIELVLR